MTTRDTNNTNRRARQIQRSCDDFEEELNLHRVKINRIETRKPRISSQMENPPKCSQCSLNHHRNRCPAWGRKCFCCGQRGHFVKVCRLRK